MLIFKSPYLRTPAPLATPAVLALEALLFEELLGDPCLNLLAVTPPRSDLRGVDVSKTFALASKGDLAPPLDIRVGVMCVAVGGVASV